MGLGPDKASMKFLILITEMFNIKERENKITAFLKAFKALF